MAETSSSSKSSSSSNVSSQDNDLPPRKDLTAEIKNRRASLSSANKNSRTPVQRALNCSRSTYKPTGVCRTINFAQKLKENNSKLLTRSPVASPNAARTSRPLSQVNEANTAVNIIKQHQATHRANILRNNVRNLQNGFHSQRRLDSRRDRHSIDKEHFSNSNNKIEDTSPSKLTSLLNATNLLNENNDKKRENGHSTTDLINSTSKTDRRTRLTKQSNEHQNKLQTPNGKQSTNQPNNLKTPIKPYPNAESPSLIKPPTAQLARHDLISSDHSPLPNQDVFNYSNLNNKFEDEDYCISETTHKRPGKHRNQATTDKVYTEQTLSASCNRLSQVPTNSNNNLQSVAAATASSTPSLNNGLNNSQNLLLPHSVMRNYEIGDLIGEGWFEIRFVLLCK